VGKEEVMGKHQRIFEAVNAHVESCGVPPQWASSVRGHKFYMENVHGEQFVALVTKDEIRFAGGDLGWENTYVIRHDGPGVDSGRWEALYLSNTLVLGDLERAWIVFLMKAMKELQ
jgi:hypothetical protein